MGKPDLGTKRACPSCGAKYYDLNRNPIVCPSCGTVFQVATSRSPERAPAPKPVPREEPAVVLEREEGVVSLEEVEEGAEPDVGPDADELEDAVVPGVEVEGEEVAAADDTFLEEDEEEGDVTNLLDVDAQVEDER